MGVDCLYAYRHSNLGFTILRHIATPVTISPQSNRGKCAVTCCLCDALRSLRLTLRSVQPQSFITYISNSLKHYFPRERKRFQTMPNNTYLITLPKKTISIIGVIMKQQFPMGNIMTNTTIALSVETKEALRSMGSKGDSYERIVRRLIKEATIKRLNDRWDKILEEDGFIPLEEL